ncbi:MAG: adenine phosphoribosyltransferase [Firmicutes bacterium]|nr:adenine phosphoribosyltransferase [Bacillota bacterium]MCD8311930.1 adenine phosphoribosyltransferase [Bacillota bacterium]
MTYELELCGLKRELPLCPLTEDLYIGAFVTFGDPELVTACAEELLRRVPDFDYMLTAESKGIPVTHEMARLAGNRRYFLARKTPKLYMTGVFEVSVKSITTKKMQKLFLDTSEAEEMKGKRILIVDDVISTGESLSALEKLVNEAGGVICGRACILAEGDAAKRDDIVYLAPLPLFDKEGQPITD